MPNPNDIRLAVATQPTVAQSVDALTRAIASRIVKQVTDTGPDSAHALATDMARDPKSWSDAVLANTPQAAETATLDLPIPVAVEGNIKDVVAAQPSVAQAVAAFLRHVCKALFDHAEGNSGDAQGLADDIAQDQRSWSDAILANTIATQPTASPLVGVPAHLTDVMATPGLPTAEQRAEEAAKAEAEKAEAEKADAARADEAAKAEEAQRTADADEANEPNRGKRRG